MTEKIIVFSFFFLFLLLGCADVGAQGEDAGTEDSASSDSDSDGDDDVDGDTSGGTDEELNDDIGNDTDGDTAGNTDEFSDGYTDTESDQDVGGDTSDGADEDTDDDSDDDTSGDTDEDTDTVSVSDAGGDTDATIDTVPRSGVLRTEGGDLLDTCGNVLVIRGFEQILGEQLPPGNDWTGIIDEIASTGANAVRVLFQLEDLSLDDMDAVMTRIGGHGMVAFVTPSGSRAWFGQPEVREMLAKHSAYLIIDAVGEPQTSDREQFRDEAIATVELIRGYGYTEPLVVQVAVYGRDLPSALRYGPDIIAADSENNTIIGWQAYWGDSNYYQGLYDMTLEQGVQAVADSGMPFQIGIDYRTDPEISPDETMAYGAVMTASETHGTGWLWWDWYNPYGNLNSLSEDGTADNLNEIGQDVVHDQPASIANTSRLACSPESADGNTDEDRVSDTDTNDDEVTDTDTDGDSDTESEVWPNIRVVGNHMHDRYGEPFAVRSIESMFGHGTSNAAVFAAGHRALGANAMGPLPNPSVSSPSDIEALLGAAYDEGLIIGLNADHAGQGEGFFRQNEIQAIVNRYPNVFLQEAIELGSGMSEDDWVAAAMDKVDAYVDLYPDKPLKIGSPFGGRSPRFPLDRCEDVVDYYYSQGGRGGLIFTCQLYWRAEISDWSYQAENGFVDGLPGIIEAVDAMAASPCTFMPGLDNNDDVEYTGWREVMDHIRESHTDPGMRLSYQWWVLYNPGDEYKNDLTRNDSDALSDITSIGEEVKAKLEVDREDVDLGPLNP